MMAAASQGNHIAAARSGAQYYKDVMAANKEIKNAIKSIKVHKIEDAMAALKIVVSSL